MGILRVYTFIILDKCVVCTWRVPFEAKLGVEEYKLMSMQAPTSTQAMCFSSTTTGALPRTLPTTAKVWANSSLL